jgi:hypothetical protein
MWLRAAPHLPDSGIAAMLNVSPTTVGKYRREETGNGVKARDAA